MVYKNAPSMGFYKKYCMLPSFHLFCSNQMHWKMTFVGKSQQIVLCFLIFFRLVEVEILDVRTFQIETAPLEKGNDVLR